MNFNNFDKVAQGLYEALGDVVAKTAFDIEALAAANAPVDTGFLKSSIYAVTEKSSNYGQAGQPTHKDSYLLPEIAQPEDQFTAYVGVGANYGVDLELGTAHQPVQPYLGPATQTCEGSFEQAVAAIESKLRNI